MQNSRQRMHSCVGLVSIALYCHSSHAEMIYTDWLVMDKTSAQVNLAADQVNLLAAQRKLTAENAQLRRNLVIGEHCSPLPLAQCFTSDNIGIQ